MRPNIVIIQADQMAAQALGAYGDAAARTPHMDALAAEGAVFDRAYCTTPLCAPSRASMMTGRMPSDIDTFDNGDDFAASLPTFAHHLRAAGYHTALIGRMHFIGPDQHHGFEQRLTTDVYPADMDMVPDWRRELGDRMQWYHDADAVYSAGVSQATVQQDFDDEVSFKSLRHLHDRVRANQAQGEDIPFLMVTSFIHPHDPYEPPQEHWDRFADVDIPAPAHPEVPDPAQDPHSHRLRAMSGFDQRDPSAEEVRRARRAYYAAVSYIDDQVGRIVGRLETLGLAENTVVLITSDHGDMLGEKGLWFKMSPYEQSARVPLILRGPDELVPRGRFANPVSLLDLLPTLVELSGTQDHPSEEGGGLAASTPATRGGRSLLESARREQAGQEGPEDRDVLIEYLAEGTQRPQVTLVARPVQAGALPRRSGSALRPGHRPSGAAQRRQPIPSMRSASSTCGPRSRRGMTSRASSRTVLRSQSRRRLVAAALERGVRRPWDLVTDPEQRYVRGDFWGAVKYGQIRLAGTGPAAD